MENTIVRAVYSDSREPVKVGDRLFVDDLPGRVTGVFMPGTKEAEDCYCEDTGALAILFNDGTAVLLPFGNRHKITKIPAAARNAQ